jgi:hypothetical protein
MLIDEFGCERIQSITCGAVPGFEGEAGHQINDFCAGSIMYTDRTPSLGQGYRSDLEQCYHRDM